MGKRLTTEEFIRRSKEIHGDTYDYSKSVYVNPRTDIIVTCRKHGDFLTRPYNHMGGAGCRKCADEKNALEYRKSNNEFVNDAKKVHGDKYNYSEMEYVNWKTKVKIICPKHGGFMQTPNAHLNGQGCPKCAIESRTRQRTMTTEEFIERAKQIHGDKYDYSEVEYTKTGNSVLIMCKKCKRKFLQTPENHLQGKGCPFCKRSKLEMEVEKLLMDNGIGYVGQMKFDWLGSKSLDFYIPSLNIAIECQGRQHFEPVKAFGGEDEYKRIVERDREKYNLCKKNGVKLLYYSHKSIFGKHELKHDVITTRKLLLEEIK